MTDCRTFLGKAVGADDLVAVCVLECELDLRAVGHDDLCRRVAEFEHRFAQVCVVEFQVKGTERRVLDEFRELAGRIRESLHNDALDLSTLVGEGHDELVGFDRHRAFCNFGLRSDCCCAIVCHSRCSSVFSATENRSRLDFRRLARNHERLCGIRCDLLFGFSLCLCGTGCSLRLGICVIDSHPPNHDDRDKDGTNECILVHFLSLGGGTGS